jgi:hypothetical protein
MSKELINAFKINKSEVESIINASPDWSIAVKAVDDLFKRMSNPKDVLWSEDFINDLHRTYLKARDEDKDCANITVRTVKAMPKGKAEDVKKIMLQIADTCRVFNAAHKVNFEQDELPQSFPDVEMKASKKKGVFTYKNVMPSLYPKTSLTFDYWVPKILDWTKEIRAQKLKEWKGETILQHESCTDFMRICLLFLSDPKDNIPIAKAEDREALLKLIGEEFVWIKKSAKREDIHHNSKKMKDGLNKVASEAGITIPLEAWNRLQQEPFIKAILK